MISAKKPHASLWLILLAAFLLRVAGISFGLYYPDEPLVVNHALAFGTGDLNPHMFYFPTLFPYILFALYGVFYVLGFLASFFHKPDDLLALVLSSPDIFYWIGRFVSVVFGTWTVAAVYGLAREYKDDKTALAAASFMAVCFLHVRDSHFAVMDVTLTFFMTVCVYFLFRYLNGKGRRNLFWAAFTAGVASSVKYNAFILCAPIALAYFLSPVFSTRNLVRDAFFCVMLMLSAFFIFSPFVILDFKNALRFIQHLYSINSHYHFPWWHHARMIFFSLGGALPFLALAGLGVDGVLVGRKKWLFFVLPTLYYLMIAKAGQPFERYVLPILPFGVIWAAIFLSRFWSKAFFWLCVITVLTVLPKVLWSDALFLRKDTRDLAREWVEKNIPSGSVLVIQDPGRVPRLNIPKEEVREKLMALKKEPNSLLGVKQKRLEKMLEHEPYPSPNYRLYYLRKIGFEKEMPEKNSFVFLGPWVEADPRALNQIGAEYLLIDQAAFQKSQAVFGPLLEHAEKVVSFDPRCSLAVNLGVQDWVFMPIDESLWGRKRNGPFLEIFKLKQE